MKIKSLQLKGYRAFRDSTLELGNLEIIVGANGAGKSSLFEFLRFLRNSMYSEIPSEIVPGTIGQQIFHLSGKSISNKFSWILQVDDSYSGQRDRVPVDYQGEVLGPVGQPHVSTECVQTSKPLGTHKQPLVYMNIREGKGVVRDDQQKKFVEQEIEFKRANQLALGTITDPRRTSLYQLGSFIKGWRFYNSFDIDNEKIRKSVPIEQEPSLREDGGNLSSVLHYLMTEHQERFDELKFFLSQVIPGFKTLTVKARGGPGEVMAFVSENGIDTGLSLADLSDGMLRLICWITLCVHPNPPSLVCIDEPDQGLHPRALATLAGLFKKLSERTQVLIAIHSSYFLRQFDIDEIAVMKKEDGEAKFFKPGNSSILKSNLKDFGIGELEMMHQNDELEDMD